MTAPVRAWGSLSSVTYPDPARQHQNQVGRNLAGIIFSKNYITYIISKISKTEGQGPGEDQPHPMVTEQSHDLITMNKIACTKEKGPHSSLNCHLFLQFCTNQWSVWLAQPIMCHYFVGFFCKMKLPLPPSFFWFRKDAGRWGRL